MSQKVIKSLLFEAYRRNHMADTWEQNKPLTKRWLGLGTYTAYKPILNAGLMRWHNGKQPPMRCMGWLCLTTAGASALQEYEKEFSTILAALKTVGYDRTLKAQYTLAGGIVAK